MVQNAVWPTCVSLIWQVCLLNVRNKNLSPDGFITESIIRTEKSDKMVMSKEEICRRNPLVASGSE